MQIFQPGDFARGVAAEGEGEIVLVDAAAVVAHPQQFLAALFQLDIDPAGAGVEAVFEQFLEHRCRALDHFAGGDLIGQARTEAVDAVHLGADSISSAARRSTSLAGPRY